MSDKVSEYTCFNVSCKKTYSSKYNLKRHIDSAHKKIRRFRCKVCKKYLSSNQNLQEHMHTHTGLKPYVCTERDCGKTFRQSCQLSNHKNFHKQFYDKCRQQNTFKELKVMTS